MSVAFKPGQTLTDADLAINIRDAGGTLVNPSYIRYSLFDATTGIEVLMGAPDRIPATAGTGVFYVDATIPLDANVGDWIVRWNFKESPTSHTIQVVQAFNIVKDAIVVSLTGDANIDLLVRRLRILLRDNNPDRNYRFRPPSTERFLQAQTHVFGYIWEDYELYEYLLFAVDVFNSFPPVTGIALDTMPERWRGAILLRAAASACAALALNWIADEYGYSISGVSLDLEKSSKYESMKNNYLTEYKETVDMVKQSIKVIVGLQQPRYGIGISSALGPYSTPGIQSRRNWIGSN